MKPGHTTDSTIRNKLPESIKLLRTFRGGFKKIGRIAWSSDGSKLAAAVDQRILVWDINSGEMLMNLIGDHRQVNCVAFDTTASIIASGNADKSVKIWDVKSGSILEKLTGHENAVCSVSWSPDGNLFVSASTDGMILIWDAKTWHLRGMLPRGEERRKTGMVLDVAWNTDSNKLAGASHQAIIWDVSTGEPICVMPTMGGVCNISWSPEPESCFLATASASNTIEIWNGDNGIKVRELEGHTTHVTAVDFSADGAFLASCSDDNTTKLWSCEDWRELATIRKIPITNSSGALAFHPLLPILATVGGEIHDGVSSGDAVIHVLRVDSSELLGDGSVAKDTYISAKVVLIGESNVGKSYLAHRISTGKAPAPSEITSTHGMKFWPIGIDILDGFVELDEDKNHEIVLWDMGGQDEYRLIHQMFLNDTTLALVLFDPTRGTSAFREVEAWNKSLEKQFRGRKTTKILVGAKVDSASKMIDVNAIEMLRTQCGFAAYCETSSLSGRGITDLCDQIVKAIDWKELGKTTRPELFQAIRDEIDLRRKEGVVTVLFDELDMELQGDEQSSTFALMAQEVALASDAAAGTRALDGVCRQLAKQGTIARARTSSGHNALVLRVEEIERYAGSLILAARKNPRGVPALELRSIAQIGYQLPEIDNNKRLERSEEVLVLECTVQLMIEHGICFEHEGMLVFPSLFSPFVDSPDEKLIHAVSLFYDFAGAIDNIYASLIAWLVLAKEFGKIRLWPDRAEFEVKNAGVCGLRKVRRTGGFAHVDVYFEARMPERKRLEFISFVEDHLFRSGVEIREHVAIKCICEHEFTEETIRQRISRGDKDVACPVCEERHCLTEGASEARINDKKIAKHTWALRTVVEERREEMARFAVEVFGRAEKQNSRSGPIRLLHLSDLHFTKDTLVAPRLQWLLDDIKQSSGLGFKELDYLIISGDFTEKGSEEGFEKAYEFVSALTKEFGLSAERCVFVPGNHDVTDILDAYERVRSVDGLKEDQFVKRGEILLARSRKKYPQRLKKFSDLFYHKFLQRPYPIEFENQGIATPFWDTGIQFIALNSSWEIDEFNRRRSSINVEAAANAIKQAQIQETIAREANEIANGQEILRIAVWHHAVSGPDQMKNTEFIGNLQKNGVQIGLHGDVHEMRVESVGYLHDKKIQIIGSGSFGARASARPESTPCLYNVLEINRDLKSMRIHTRCQSKVDGPWDGWHEWKNPKSREGRLPYYDVKL